MSVTSSALNVKTFSVTMPPSHVTATATFKKVTYDVFVQTVKHGQVTASQTTAQIGDTVTLDVISETSPQEYKLNTPLYIFAKDPPIETENKASSWTATTDEYGIPCFTITSANIDSTVTTITVAPRFVQDAAHTVTVLDGIVNGAVTRGREKAPMGDTVRLFVTPQAGYRLDTLTVKDASDNTISVSPTYSFTMPNSNVTVFATFTPAQIRQITKVVKPDGGGAAVAKNAEGNPVTEISEGSPVTLEATPKEGYELTSLTVRKGTNDPNGEEVPLPKNALTLPAKEPVVIENAFFMPTENATVTAVFKMTQTITPITPSGGKSDSDNIEVAYGDTVEKIAEANGGAALTYTVTEGADVISVYANGKLTTKKVGTAVVKIEAAETNPDDPAKAYSSATKDVTVTVTQRNLKVTAEEKTKTYGETDPAPTHKIEGITELDKDKIILEGELTRDEGENVGEYAITQGTLAPNSKAGANYAIAEYLGANLTIKPATLTVTAKPKSITYGDAPTNDGVSYDAFVNGENEGVLSGTLSYAYSYTQYGDVGNNYTITPSGLSSDNYAITCKEGALTVNPKTLSLTWGETSFTYDGASHAPGATATEIVNGDDVTVTVTGEQTDAGTYTATATLSGEKSGNYALPEAKTKDFTITPATLTGVSVEQDGTLTYNGEARTPNVTTAATAVNNQPVTFAYSATEGGAYGDMPAFTDAGTYTVYYKASAPNHNDATGSFAVTIGKVPAPSLNSLSAGQKPTATNPTYNGENQALVAAPTDALPDGYAIQYSTDGGETWTDNPAGTDAKKYPVKVKYVGNKNHTDFDGEDIDSTIAQRPVKVSDITAKDKTYDGSVNAELIFTGAKLGGKLDKDTLTVTATGAFEDANVGNDKIVNISALTLEGASVNNYALAADGQQTTAKANITAASLPDGSVSADDVRVTYDGNPHGITVKAPEGASVTYGTTAGTYDQNASPTITNVNESVLTVYYQATMDNYEPVTGFATVTINKAEPDVTAPKANELTYTGEPLALVTKGTATGGVMRYALGTKDAAPANDSSDWSESVPTGTNAGTYYVWHKADGDGNHTNVAPASVAVTIDKATPTVTAPKAKQNLTYTGEPQKLVTAGETTGGKMVYSLKKNGPYDEEIPAETDAGDYRVYYKVEGNDNYNGMDTPKSVWVTIERKSGGDKPTVVIGDVTATTITVDEPKGDYEYSNNGGKNWQDSNVFEDLTPETEYPITARKKGADNEEPGPVSDTVKVTTKSDKTNVRALTFYSDSAGTTILKSESVSIGASLAQYQDVKPADRDNYTFAAWSPDPNIQVSAFRDKNGNLTEGVTVVDWTGKMPDKDMNAYPIWIHDRLNIRLNLGAYDENNKESWYHLTDYDARTPAQMDASQGRDFTVDLNERIAMKKLIAATRAGYELTGWYTQDGVRWNGDNWKTLSYTDGFHETVEWSVTPTYCDKDENGNELIQTNEQRVYKYYTVTLTARWEPLKVSLTYAGEGANMPTDDKAYRLGDTITIAAAPVPPNGKTFVGWTDKKGVSHNPGEEFVFEDWTLQTDGVITLTSTFKDAPGASDYAISFDSNGGTPVDPIANYPLNEPIPAPNEPTRTGYKFKSWYDEQGNPIDFLTLRLTEAKNRTFKAEWTVNQYTISFKTNGGAEITPITQDYGTPISAPKDPVKEHYDFGGWRPELPKTMPAKDTTLEAQWTPTEYTLTWRVDENDQGQTITEIYGGLIPKPDDPVKDGYTFTGWEPVFPTYMPDNNPVITAQWKKSGDDKPNPPEATATDTTITVTKPNPEDGHEAQPRGRLRVQ